MDLDPSQKMKCPSCMNTMERNFYSFQYFVVVDRCFMCNLLWFDKDELEMLQAMVESSPVGS